jgi:predicted nucleic acid-binding protein
MAVDSNILVYAHREDSPWHPVAWKRLSALAESGVPWAIPLIGEASGYWNLLKSCWVPDR